MQSRRDALVALALATGMMANSALAAEPDPDLPQPLDLSIAAPLLEKSPFTRALNLSEKLQLTGIAYVQGKPVATIVDRETKQNYLVSDEPNSQGWKLAGASASSTLRASSVQLQVGNETVIVHYGEAQIAPTSSSTGGRVGPSVWPSEQEVMRTDENGKPYVRSSAYLSDADRERYYRGWSRDAHEKYRGILMEQREKMLNASPQQRAEIAKKVFDQVDTDEKARGGSPRGDSGGPSYRGGYPGGPGGSSYRGGPPGSPGGSSYRGGPPSGAPGGPPFGGGTPR